MKPMGKNFLKLMQDAEELRLARSFTIDEWIFNLKELEQHGTGAIVDDELKLKVPNLLEAEKVYHSKLYKALK